MKPIVDRTCGLALALAGVLASAPETASAQCLEGCVAIHTLVGEAAGDQFGWEARVLGDVDGDGINDFIASSPTNDAGGVDAGRVYVYSGATGAELYRVTGTIGGAQFGFSCNPLGDVTGDLVPDFIVGTPGAGNGLATVFSGVDGTPAGTVGGEAAGDQFGLRAVGEGDLDGDGTPDFLVGAPQHDTAANNAGRVYGFSGADGSPICTADGSNAGHNFGTALAFVGDLDGDGRDEFVVGAPNAGALSNGRAYIYSYDGAACNRIQTFVPTAPSVDFGQFFADGREDVNADGIPDIYVPDFNVNKAYVYSGADFSTLWTLTGDGNGGFGIGEIMPDIDNDGHADLILAAWISNIGGSQAGKTFVYSGRTGAVLQTLTHNIAGATFGFDAAGLGDVNGDGRHDYLITAAWDAGQRGTTYVIAGAVTPFLDADLDLDGCVELDDLLVVLGDFGCAAPGCAGDIDDNQSTDLDDLLLVLGSFDACR